MKKRTIIEELFAVESKLLEVSTKIKAEGFDSIESWIEHVLEHDHDLAQYFLIPNEPHIRQSLLNVIRSNTFLPRTVLNALAIRIASYIASTGDLKSHPLGDDAVATIVNNFYPLTKLVKRHTSYSEHKASIERIAVALRDSRLHIYKTYAGESDLRVVLKTLQVDQSRDDGPALQYLLEFLFHQLMKNLEQREFISQPHHAWWALLDLFSESSSDWLHNHSSDLDKIIGSLLRDTEYIPRAIDPASVLPELNSVYYEKIWITINMMRIYKTNVAEYVDEGKLIELRARIETNIKALLGDYHDDSLKSIQCKLLFLYETLGYLNYLQVVDLCNSNQIDLRARFIGKYFYDDDVMESYGRIRTAIERFIANRRDWDKHSLSSLLVSGSAGMGKSELIKQVIDEIGRLTSAYDKQFSVDYFTIGSQIASKAQLDEKLKLIESRCGADHVQVIVFDEFEKASADLDFALSLLPVLEWEIQDQCPLTIWVFAQSSFPTSTIIESHAESLPNKSLRDFLTRIQLGRIDLPSLKTSPQQKILTVLGYAINTDPGLEQISRNCLGYFATNESLQNNRQLIKHVKDTTHLSGKRLSLSEDIHFSLRSALNDRDEWMTITR